MALFALFEVFDAGQQHTGVGNDGAARFEDQLQIATDQLGLQRGGILLRMGWILVAVVDAQTTTDIQVMDVDAFGRQTVNQGQQTIHRLEEGLELGQLGADVAVDADDVDIRQGGGSVVQGNGALNRHTELILLEAGGDVGVGTGIDIRVDPYRDARHLAHVTRDCV